MLGGTAGGRPLLQLGFGFMSVASRRRTDVRSPDAQPLLVM
jgi:hypothetical protein